MSTLERTFAMIKPDGVARGLMPDILNRIVRKGYRIVGLKQLVISADLAAAHYAEHVGKPFYADLQAFITSGPVWAIALEGEDVIAGWRAIMGTTSPATAAAGTIRFDLAIKTNRNVVHGSAHGEDAARELALFFTSEELLAAE